MISTSRGSSRSRLMLVTNVSGLNPASNKIRWVRPACCTVISAEKPCSAIGACGIQPSSNNDDGARTASPVNGRLAGPLFTASMSVTLSTSVVMVTESTGSSGIDRNGVACSAVAATGTAAATVVVSHMGNLLACSCDHETMVALMGSAASADDCSDGH